MDYESIEYECDLHNGYIVLTHKDSGLCGLVYVVDTRRKKSGPQMLRQDVRKYGEEKALAVYAKLVTDWQ